MHLFVGYFRITFGGLSAGMECALVLVVLYGVGTHLCRDTVGAGWRLDLIGRTVAGRTDQRQSSLRRIARFLVKTASDF